MNCCPWTFFVVQARKPATIVLRGTLSKSQKVERNNYKCTCCLYWAGCIDLNAGEIHNEGRLKGWALKVFFEPLNGSERSECHLCPKNPRSPQSQTPRLACNFDPLIFRYYLRLRAPDYLSYCGHEAPAGGEEAGVLVLLSHDLVLQNDRREAATAPTALTVVTAASFFSSCNRRLLEWIVILLLRWIILW